MKKLLWLAAATLPLAACSTTELAQSAYSLQKARQAADTARVAHGLMTNDGDAVAPEATNFADAAPIDASPMAVKMKRTDGKTSVLAMQPKIAVAGYNVGAINWVSATGTVSGSLFSNSQGARSTVELTTQGIDEVLLSRIAKAAEEDLVAQLTAAGFSVVPAAQVAGAANAGPLKFHSSAYEKKYTGEGRKKVLVAGPGDVGVRDYFTVAKTTFGGNGSVKLSGELGAVVLMPNLVLDFADVDTNGRWSNKASASAALQFGIEPSSTMAMHVSKNGRFLDGWLSYGLDGTATTGEEFATMGEVATNTNALEQGLGMALRMGTANKKKNEAIVVIDRDRYEALALKAAKGWNAAFVQQLSTARS